MNEALKSLLFVSIVINQMDQTMNAQKTLNVILSQVNLTLKEIDEYRKFALILIVSMMNNNRFYASISLLIF